MSNDLQKGVISEMNPLVRIGWSLAKTAACLGLAGWLVSGSGPVLVSHNNPQVHLSGHVDCGGLDSPESISYSTDSGETGTGDLEDWTSISRPLSKVVGKEIPGISLVKIQTYNIVLNDVPKDGTQVHLDVTCGNDALGGTGGFSTSFGIRRPLIGTDATRHICDKGPFNPFPCVV